MSEGFVATLAARFDQIIEALPGYERSWLTQARRAHFAAFARHGFPSARDERWRYSSLKTLQQRAFAFADPGAGTYPVDLRLLPLPSIAVPLRLVFVNGAFRADLSLLDNSETASATALSAALEHGNDIAGLRRFFLPPNASKPADAFARLNTALASDGALIEVKNQAKLTLHLLFIGAANGRDVFWNARNRIDIGAGAEVTLIEQHCAIGSSAHLGNVFTELVLQSGAQLRHTRLMEAAGTSSLIARTEVRVGGAAHYRPLLLELGGALSRHELIVALESPQASADVRGAVRVDGQRRIDTRLTLAHEARDTRSDTRWRAIADQHGRAAFHGGITILAGADDSAAALDSKSLLLAASAEIDAQPVLEIYADQVKASHGAAVGQLDADALFYLRSRGLPKASARAILTTAFLREMLSETSPRALHAWLLERLIGQTDHEAD